MVCLQQAQTLVQPHKDNTNTSRNKVSLAADSFTYHGAIADTFIRDIQLNLQSYLSLNIIEYV